MDLASSCKNKLAFFRIRELKDVLTQLGLAKRGKKQDLVDRILTLFSDEQGSRSHGWAKKSSIGKEGVAQLIDDTYRKLQAQGATDLASTGQNGSGLSGAKPKEEVDDSFELDMKICCPCGSSLHTDTMIKCEDPRCQVWQHIDCVIIPEKPTEGVPPELPIQFYCEICRLKRADPFSVTVTDLLLPVKMTASNLPTDGTNPVQNVEETFQLTRADRDLLQKTDHDLQAWCILLNDKVSFRMQWPQHTDLQVNGMPIRVTNRPGSQLLGINGRDDGPAITTCCREGVNKISLSGCDARIFCMGVRIVRRKTVLEVLNLVPKVSDGERFEEALARVCRCLGRGAAAENADSDSDLEVVADSVTVNLRCPMSGSRMKVAGRFKPCVHMGCFDLETFVELNQRSRKWQCPICLKNYSLENVIIDPYFNRITSLMKDCREDVTEIDVKPDGSWRAKNECEHRDLVQWHFPDGSLCVTKNGGMGSELEISKQQIKQEFSLEERTSLKIGIKRNHNGIWEVRKPKDMRPTSSRNHLTERSGSNCPKVMPMSSSGTGSYRDGDDPSVNQEFGGHFDFPTNNCNEPDSTSLDFDPMCSAVDRISSAPLTDVDVIVLSDSEDDNILMKSPDTVHDVDPVNGDEILFSPPPRVTESYPEDNPCLSDFGMPLWPSPACPEVGPGFQLFGTVTDVSGTFVDVQPTPVPCPATLNGCGLATGTNMQGASQVEDSLVGGSNTETDVGLVDNPLAFGTDDPSFQIFLPTRPVGVSVQADARDDAETSNGIRSADWISLRLGGGSSHGDSADKHGSKSRKQHASFEGSMEPLDNNKDTASLLPSMNNDDDGSRRDQAAWRRPRSGGPFSHPRQPRSVRPRLHLSIDINDSE
ncbi:E3 SUMO-protein ligase SIZ1-like isoform X2 [Magnolia sinica]|uniref:E3 SUMO-protein ligase SIZ1-like isoform X2 n=1 Tax=Magnolia sinica TaxID=86752 RepID=UPI002658A622|nr:E3 SUMO-protein ligase SIZ1-like isoform X2 [Magnolia sinica]